LLWGAGNYVIADINAGTEGHSPKPPRTQEIKKDDGVTPSA